VAIISCIGLTGQSFGWAGVYLEVLAQSIVFRLVCTTCQYSNIRTLMNQYACLFKKWEI